MDGTRLVDDSLNLDFHDMGTFLISGINGVRIPEHPMSNEPHDRMEFKGTVRGWQSEERQEWIDKLLGEGEQRGGKRAGSDGETMVDAKCPSSPSPSPVVVPDAGNHDLTPSRGAVARLQHRSPDMDPMQDNTRGAGGGTLDGGLVG